VGEQGREGLIALLERQSSEVQEYLAAIKAPPTVAVRVDPQLHLGNGKQRS
jgi:hypothetical protein